MPSINDPRYQPHPRGPAPLLPDPGPDNYHPQQRPLTGVESFFKDFFRSIGINIPIGSGSEESEDPNAGIAGGVLGGIIGGGPLPRSAFKGVGPSTARGSASAGKGSTHEGAASGTAHDAGAKAGSETTGTHPDPAKGAAESSGAGAGPSAQQEASSANLKDYDIPVDDRNTFKSLLQNRRGLDSHFSAGNKELNALRKSFFERQKKLSNDANAFFKSQKESNGAHATHSSDMPEFSKNENQENIIKKALSKSSGIVIGEVHGDVAPKKFLIDNFKNLKKNGVKTLYMEHLQSDLHGDLLKEYNQSPPNAKMPRELQEFLAGQNVGQDPGDTGTSVKKKYNFITLIKSAHENGIEIVPLDSAASYNLDKNNYALDRTKIFNFYASNTILQHQAQNAGGKFVSLMGSSHTNEFNGVPGVADLTGAIGIRIEAGPTQGIAPDPGKIGYMSITDRGSRVKADFLLTMKP